MARKGWDQLSENYRKRLQRNGVTQADYDRGKPLDKARGHAKPSGVSERKWESLVKLAKRADWQTIDPKELLESELAKGETPEDLADALRLKIAAQRAYKRDGRDSANKIWQRRNPLHAREIYWYHVHK